MRVSYFTIFLLTFSISVFAINKRYDLAIGQTIRIDNATVSCGYQSLPGSCNSYGCWRNGGGCNSYGCWNGPNGSCNSYGCTNNGHCNSYGCSEYGECNSYGCP